MAKRNEIVFTVTMLNEYANGILSNDLRLSRVRVCGEISGFKRHASGHLYFSLKDSNASVRCVMFKSSAMALKFLPKNGMQVVIRGAASIYPKDGQYQLYVESIQEQGEGDLYRHFLELKERLTYEGVFDNKRPLPRLPGCIGVVTSESGSALHDILNIIRRRFPQMNILFAPCPVQGESAPDEIVAAITAIVLSKKCDVMIVARGGGSYEDLFCFNDEAVARTIASCPIPVVTGIGHETDFTIADFAADLRAPTPSAAAELCCPIMNDIVIGLSTANDKLENLVQRNIDFARTRLKALCGSAALSDPNRAIGILRARLVGTFNYMDLLVRTAVVNAVSQNDGNRDIIESVSPASVLKRGYALLTDDEGKFISEVSTLKKDMSVKVHLSDGSAKVKIISVEKI